jgi:hypothetical protein
MEKRKLTSASVGDLRLPDGKDDYIFWDSEVPGFGVRLRPGKATWIIQYRVGVKQRRHTLGDVKTLNGDKARKAAKDRHSRKSALAATHRPTRLKHALSPRSR